ncbi:hypothetical protein LEP1GSC040_1559 [Leptospira santarosai str. 2000030832]|nr:hypothetical protein LEP1GSC040_1559 [Leptospira santarosai str. 2000030832]
MQSKDERSIESEIAKSRGAEAVGSLQSKDERSIEAWVAFRKLSETLSYGSRFRF